jgi:hypothetical protein
MTKFDDPGNESLGVILGAPFFNKSALRSFSLIIVYFVIFWLRNFSIKAARKMLVQLTTGHQRSTSSFYTLCFRDLRA